MAIVAALTWHPFAFVAPHAQARFGVVVSPEFGAIEQFDAGRLGVGWYYDYRVSAFPRRPARADYVQMIRASSPDWSRLALAVLANRGSLWMIGNEPDNRFQDARTPQTYARIYHDVSRFIRRLDSHARIAIGGVTQPTPLRLRWLDEALAAYEASYGGPMPVDVWNVHVYISPEAPGSWGVDVPVGLDDLSGALYTYTIQDSDRVDIFVDGILSFRRWMKEHGQQNKPLLVSEFGVLMPVELGFSFDRVNAFMQRTCEWMLTARDPDLGYPPDGNRLVQRWSWFSLNEPQWNSRTNVGFNGGLLDPTTGALTPMGEQFARLASKARSD